MIDERTGLEILDESECWELLKSKEVGRVAISIANKPDIFPVNYKLDNKAIYIHTAPGTKLAAAILGSGVAFEIDDLDESHSQGWSVVVHGTGSEVEGVEAVMDADDLEIRPWAEAERLRYLRIDIEDISGRRIPTQD